MFEDGEMEETENNEESTSLSGDEDSVLREELKLLLEVQQGLLLEASEDKEDPELKNQFGEIIEIRDSLAEARTEDLPALMAQMERMVILKHQQQNTQSSSFIDPESPYFGHMRLLENGRGQSGGTARRRVRGDSIWPPDDLCRTIKISNCCVANGNCR